MFNDDQLNATDTKRRTLETVVVERARCPKCDGMRLRKYRSIRDQGDGTSLSWVQCQDVSCGHRFRVLFE